MIAAYTTSNPPRTKRGVTLYKCYVQQRNIMPTVGIDWFGNTVEVDLLLFWTLFSALFYLLSGYCWLPHCRKIHKYAIKSGRPVNSSKIISYSPMIVFPFLVLFPMLFLKNLSEYTSTMISGMIFVIYLLLMGFSYHALLFWHARIDSQRRLDRFNE